MNNRQIDTIHIHGTLAADAQGIVPMTNHVGATLLEVAAVASNVNSAVLAIGIGGVAPDADGFMTDKAIGQSGAVQFFTVADFDGVLADPIRTTCPILGPQSVLTWALKYGGAAPVNEQQTITLTGSPTGGTFTLSFGGQTTAAIAYNAAAATVQTALQALSSIGASNATVAGSAGGPWTVTFVVALAAKNVGPIALVTNSLTGGTAPTVVVATTVEGFTQAAAANVDLVFTLLLGSVHSGVSGLTP